MTTGEQIVAAARSWLGTRFHHQGRLKKDIHHSGGVDCLGLLMGIADELRLYSPDGVPLIQKDETDYAHFPDPGYLRRQLAKAMYVIPEDSISVGDIILLAINDNPQHLAIVSDYQPSLGIIHAYAPAHAVVEHVLDSWWQERIVAAYRVA